MSLNRTLDWVISLLVRFFRAEWSGAFLAILIMGISIEIVTSGRPFFHPTNLMTILNNSAAIGVIAGGMTLVIITAGIDLSVGSVMGMTAALTGYVSSFWGFTPELAICTGLLLGLAVGAFNGTLVAYFGMPAFIVTLAGLSIWRGVGHLSTGAQATPKLPSEFDTFGRDITNVGDFDGDGIIDLAVGAYRDDDGGKDKGAIYILFLNSDATVKSYQKISDTSGNFDLIRIIINFLKNIFF